MCASRAESTERLPGVADTDAAGRDAARFWMYRRMGTAATLEGAVRLMGQNLRLELRGTGVRVTEICPGRVSTEFYDASVPDPATRDRLKTTGIREISPGDIADAILYAISAPAHVNVSTIELQPVEQSFGGVGFDPIDWEGNE